MATDRALRRVLLTTLGMLVAAAFAGLGFWQAGRAEQKAHWLAAFERALVAPPQPLAEALARPTTLPQRVAGPVLIDPALPWLLLDNQRRDATVGIRAYRIARVDGSASSVLVDFGWLPLSPQRDWPQLPNPPARIDAAGLLAPPPSAGWRMADNPRGDGAEPRVLLYVDPSELSERFGVALASRVLRLDPAVDGGFVRDLVALPNTLPPEQHRGYAVQWFGLSATVLVVTGLLIYRSRHR